MGTDTTNLHSCKVQSSLHLRNVHVARCEETSSGY